MLSGIIWINISIPVSARSLAEIKESGEIRICIATFHVSIASVEPEGCRENCKFQGIAYEEAQAFAKTLPDVRPKYIFVGWDEQFHNKEGKTVREDDYTPKLLECGECDLYPSHLTQNTWRSKKLAFVSLFPNRMMVVVPQAKKTLFKSQKDLAGKVAALEKDTGWHTWVQEQNQSTFSTNPVKLKLVRPDQITKALEENTIDFTLFDSDNALWSMRHQLKYATIVFPVGPIEQIGWAFRKEDKDLQGAVRQFFNGKIADKFSILNKIWINYYGMTLPEFTKLISTIKD
jgi:membrane-bound lytic murein transglycosylase MltF